MHRADTEAPGMVPLLRPPADAATTWGPYYDTLHPPRRVAFIVNWKAVPGMMTRAMDLWQRRQELRGAYEAEHGDDPGMWPARHPGVVVGSYAAGSDAACLGCHWLFRSGYHRHDGVFQDLVDLALLHETSDGVFRGGEDRLLPTAWPTPSPPPVVTPAIPRRVPVVPLGIADRYSAGRPRVPRHS